jgi:type IV pilus assembly protein PilB
MAASTLTVWSHLPLIDEPLTLHENAVHYDEPLIQFVDNIIQHALQKSASDIHIEPYESICRIRYRQDGLLHEVTEIPNNLADRLMTRLKVMAKLDISERRLPQDGRFQLSKHAIDVRINTCPTLFGEKIVLRILDANKILFDVNALGMTDWQKQIFLEKISHPQGLILVTGPTGSGKTVTLYSALHALNTTEKNILTAEDPVEIKLHGINQVNINPKIGLQFATVLRTFLRQDPDVIMIGEIRDTETAEIAIQAAQTGHLVLSTLHTNNAIETLMRLESMGISRYNLSNAISLIIAQRLVRKICVHCHAIDFVQCAHCFQGYLGRAGIYEMLPMDEKISRLIAANASIATLNDHLDQEGFLNLRRMGLEKVSQGITTFSEINRVIL